ncbi:MAG: CBS domain-containing protein [Alphaproteobacteria bacterium]|nr:CBS domain-containing protein [Alphaproteobacteria bacterium]
MPGELRASDIMTSPAVYVMLETPVGEIARVLLKHRIKAVPVVGSGGRMVGIVSEGDLVRHAPSTGRARRSWWLDMIETNPAVGGELRNYLEYHGLRAKDVMSENVVFVEEDMPVTVIAELLQQKGVNRVPVLRDGRPVGILSQSDLLAALVHSH